MKLTIRCLRTDGTVTTTVENAPRYRIKMNAVVYIGTQMRKADPSIAALRCDEITKAGVVPCYTWVGFYTKEHEAAFVKAGVNW